MQLDAAQIYREKVVLDVHIRKQMSTANNPNFMQ